MNLNAPEHQPSVADDATIITFASDKMFSDPDPIIAGRLNQFVKDLEKVDVRRAWIRTEHEGKEVRPALPVYPKFSVTPSPSISNVCTGISINLKQGLQVLNPASGTPTICTQAQLEFVCEYANTWHSALSESRPVNKPKFFCLSQEFYKDLMSNTPQYVTKKVLKHLSRSQFWKLRYLFIPVKFTPTRQSTLHAALCALSPEAKTVDYICSNGDTGLLNSPQSAGSKCVPPIFAWLADYIGKNRGGSFFPFDWKLRVNAGRQQSSYRGDCGIYFTTHAMCLAFGYGVGSRTGSFPRDHQAKLMSRRRRYAQDLLHRGFEPFNPAPNAPNWQYYPLLDKKPTASSSEGFVDIPLDIIEKLPPSIAHRRSCYIACKTKAQLILHCQRNARFYPGFDLLKISESTTALREFIEWVEDMDYKRLVLGYRPLPYPTYKPRSWIDPKR
ncbi:hypothetical protein N431DRAFT_466398 [Stipitochalara longipes BDJ]|nr:hypothetical protein N431DRAFT_466398 [Stipitochalara longipes BDJ]